MCILKAVFLLTLLCANISFGYSKQRPSNGDDDANPLIDIASMFIQGALNNGNSGQTAQSFVNMATVLGSLMQPNGQDKSSGGGAMEIISSIGNLLSVVGNNNEGHSDSDGRFDPSIITNLFQMLTPARDNDDDQNNHDHKRSSDSGFNLEPIIQMASAFMGQYNNGRQKRFVDTSSQTLEDNNNISLLPLLVDEISSFFGPEGKRTEEKHKSHSSNVPPLLERLHIFIDHFSTSELAKSLFKRSGVSKILKGFINPDGKMDYEKLFESLNNQSFRRHWIKTTTLYLADWVNYLFKPENYKKYFDMSYRVFNNYIKAQGYPENTLFDPSNPSETISNFLDHVIKNGMSLKIDSRQYVRPIVGYITEIVELGHSRGLLQFNATDISDKLTDTLNLEVIEPVLKIRRAYNYILQQPNCDSYVLCQLNNPKQYNGEETRGYISGVSPKILKLGSIGSIFSISLKTGTPFWKLFNIIITASDCEDNYPADCSGFHEGEAKVIKEYIHNEL